MFYRTMSILMFFICVAMVVPAYALTDEELSSMPMDELVKLEHRLNKILAIRKIESNINNLQSGGSKSKTRTSATPRLAKKFGQDSTVRPLALPKSPTTAILPKKNVQPTVPAKQTMRLHRAETLPRIASIWGSVEDGLFASLEVKNGLLTVEPGDEILSGRYSVKSITTTGVIVNDRRKKPHRLPFKPFETATQRSTTKIKAKSIIPVTSSFGQSSEFVPPLSGFEIRN